LENSLILELTNITKSFGSTHAIRNTVLKGVSLSAEKGEFITILGSSGCGKTTLLRIIAGLEEADSGSVVIEKQDVTQLEPNKRDVNTVFQNYALFPHMNVGENIAYPLKLKHKPKNLIKEKVKNALSLVQLEGYDKRMPDELSGGQKQRVAIARAIVSEPKVLLLDVPLGALDLNLRRQMQIELKKLQKQLGITFIYITHDQEEALTMSDRIAIMHNGKFIQIGTPSEIYDSPANTYTARFVGEANVLPAAVVENITGGTIVNCFGEKLTVRSAKNVKNIHTDLPPGSHVNIAVRSEAVKLFKESDINETPEIQNGGILCTVTEKNFVGGLMKLILSPINDNSGYKITASRYGITADISEGDRIIAYVPPFAAIELYDEESEGGC